MWTKEHRKEYYKKWYQEHLEEKKEYQKKWREKNPEKRKEYNKKWREKYPEKIKKWKEKNPEKVKENKKKWTKEHPEKVKERQRKWQKEHPEYMNYSNAIRRARLRGVEGNYTLQEWKQKKKEFNYACPMCGKKEPEIRLSIDHIIPISKGGANWIGNIQPLCRSCNSRKYTKTINYVCQIKN